MWKTETIPEDWGRREIVKLPKKGDLRHCENSRGISLLSVALKLFSRILLNRMKTACEELLDESRAGFRAGRSCNNWIFTLRELIAHHNEYGLPLLVTFVDFAKAFDSLHRGSMFQILRCYGLPPKVVNLIHSMYARDQARVRVGAERTAFFPVAAGVRQGCLLSPLIFILCLNYLMEKVQEQMEAEQRLTGIQWAEGGVMIRQLAYADDVALCNSDGATSSAQS